MNRMNPSVDQEALIIRSRNGVKLISAKSLQGTIELNTGMTVAKIYEQKCNIYFMDNHSRWISANDSTAHSFNLMSSHDATYKTASHFMNKEHALRMRNNDIEVISSNQVKIFDEHAAGIKGVQDTIYLSVKSPWYDEDNKIIGIFGYAVAIKNQPIAESIKVISGLGLLESQFPFSNVKRILSKLPDCTMPLTPREIEVLHHFIIGQSAKNVAKMIGISHRTAEHHLENIRKKLAVKSKSELLNKLFEIVSSN